MKKANADADPYYLQLANELRHRILGGDFKPGQRFFSTRKLIKESKRSLPTVRSAVKILVDEGYLMARHGSGYYVTEKITRQRNKKSSKILVCIPSYLSPYEPAFTGHIVTGMINAAEGEKAIVSFFQRNIPLPLRTDEKASARDLELILSENPAGIAWLHAFPMDAFILKELRRLEIPVITTVRKLPGIDLPMIRENDHLHAMLALSQFQAHGHEHVGVITRESQNDDYFASKHTALLRVASSLGIELPERNIYCMKSHREIAAVLNMHLKKAEIDRLKSDLVDFDADVSDLELFLNERPHLTGLYILATTGIYPVTQLMERSPASLLNKISILLNMQDGVKVSALPTGESLARITPPLEELGEAIVNGLFHMISGGDFVAVDNLIPRYVHGASMKRVVANARIDRGSLSPDRKAD